MTGADIRHAEIARRYKAKQANKPRVSIAAVRIAELHRLFRHRYGRTLPDDDAGRDDVQIMAHHLAQRPGDAKRRIRSYIELQAPWMPPADAAALIDSVVAKPIRWRADKLALRLQLTEAVRRHLGITTIGAIDMTKEERKLARKLRQRQRDRARRRAAGAKPRIEYEANSVNRTKPWIAAGISRRTWYRQRGTSASAA